MTLVSNHQTGKFVWGAEGKDAGTLDAFFDEIGSETSEAITAMSMDMGPAYEKSARKDGHAVNAVICYDPFHVVQLVTKALDQVRRSVWQDLRKLPDQQAARRFKGARWALLKNPDDLSDDQAATLRKLKRRGGDLWRAYALKEALRAVFAGDLPEEEVAVLLDRFCSKASRSRLGWHRSSPPPKRFVNAGRVSWPQCASGSTRPPRRTQPPGSTDRQPRLRLPLRQRCARTRHAHPRTHQARTPTRTVT